jgi:hypothetical protein
MKDANSVSTFMAVDNVTGSPVPVQIDPVTGRILAELYLVADTTTTPVPVEKDANSVATVAALADDSSGVYSVVFDQRNSLPLIDLVQE